MAPTPGTLPAYPPYQPGALSLTGQEILYLVSTVNATLAASYRIPLTDAIGKAPSVMTAATPVSSDRIAFFQAASGLPMSCSLAALNIALTPGQVATGGTSGQIYIKNSGTDFDASWGSSITNLTVVNSTVSNLVVASLLSAIAMTANAGTVTSLVANSFTTNTITATTATITNLTVATTATLATAVIGTAIVSNGLGVGTTVAPAPGFINASSAVQVNGQSLARVLLTTITPAGLASAVATVFSPSNYSAFIVEINGLTVNTNTTALQMQIATVGTTFVSGGYVSMVQTNVSSVITTDTSTTILLLSGTRVTTSLSSSANYGWNGTFEIRRAGASVSNVIRGSAGYLSAAASGTASVAMADFVGYLDVQNPVTAISLLPASGTFGTNGNIKIYGLI